MFTRRYHRRRCRRRRRRCCFCSCSGSLYSTTRVYINTSMYECTRGLHTHTRARYAYVCGVYARSHLDRHTCTKRRSQWHTCAYIYIYSTRIAVQREKREYSLAQARACFGHARVTPLFALHCVYMYTYGIISTSTNGGLFERVKTLDRLD